MNNNKGITLVSLMGYVILTITILAVLTSLSIHFRRNLSDMDTKTIQDSKFDKINLQMLEETKTSGNSINIDETTTQKIVFTNGNTYTYDSSELAVYLNDNIEVIDNVTLFNATVEEKTKEIPYSEFKNNKTKYRAVPNSYNEETKTILVYC